MYDISYQLGSTLAIAMASSHPVIPLDSFVTFGDLLKYLRRRARLTQREVAIAVGYSEAQISRLEQNVRPPELASVMALFVPALYIDDEPEIIARLMQLAAQARGETLPEQGVISFATSTKREVTQSIEVQEEIKNNLPLSWTSFIGRMDETGAIRQALQGKARLVTLAGTGGCGKTRLALHAAETLIAHYEDGVWFIDLASIMNPDYVTQAVLTTLGAPDARETNSAASLLKFLRTRHLLLILDNCEQIISAAAQLAEEILRTCPHVQILATSREVLKLPGEVVLQVQPLSLPDKNSFDDSDATRLFLDRTRLSLPNFALDEDTASRVAQICIRLDGMPLALELAASRLRTLSVGQIASLLDDRFNLLTTGSRTALPRQQTLRATIDWSYDLLSEEEQKCFRSLSVFVGGFDFEAAQVVIAESTRALDVVAQLVDKSLIVVDRLARGETRYRLLETIRVYALEKLQGAGEEAETRKRHFEYFKAFAEKANRGLRGRDQVQWMKQLEREHDNLRAALQSTLDDDSPIGLQSGLRLALTLQYFSFLRGYHAEQRDWIQHFMSHPKQPRLTPEFARALGSTAHWQVDPTESRRLFDECLSLSYALENDQAIAAAHSTRAAYGWREDDPSAGRYHFEKSIETYRRLDDQWHVARELAEFGEYAQVRLNERSLAFKAFEESLQISRTLEDKRGMAFALIRLGDLVIEQNKIEDAKQYCSEGLVLAEELDDMETLAWGINDLGVVAMCEGNLEEAEHLCVESIKISQDWANAWHTVIRRYWLARVVVYQGDEARAFELLDANKKESKAAAFDWGYAASIQILGDLALQRGDLEQARELHTEAIQILHAANYGYSLAYSLDSFAALAFARNQPEHALILFAAADAYRELIQVALLPPEQEERGQLLERVKNSIRHEKISALVKQGHAMSHAEAVQFALQ